MRAAQAASFAGFYQVRSAADSRHLHLIAVIWTLLFVVLQLVAPLLLAFTLRASYKWRSAVCFTIGVGCFLLLDAAGLFGVLVWLRFRLGSG